MLHSRGFVTTLASGPGAAGRPSAVLRPCTVVFRGARWPGEVLAARAAGWRAEIAARVRPMPDVVGAVIENSPDAIALLFAVSSLPTAVAVLPADPRAWRSDPPFPPGMDWASLARVPIGRNRRISAWSRRTGLRGGPEHPSRLSLG